jgi:hypothetical protein
MAIHNGVPNNYPVVSSFAGIFSLSWENNIHPNFFFRPFPCGSQSILISSESSLKAANIYEESEFQSQNLRRGNVFL